MTSESTRSNDAYISGRCSSKLLTDWSLIGKRETAERQVGEAMSTVFNVAEHKTWKLMCLDNY